MWKAGTVRLKLAHFPSVEAQHLAALRLSAEIRFIPQQPLQTTMGHYIHSILHRLKLHFGRGTAPTVPRPAPTAAGANRRAHPLRALYRIYEHLVLDQHIHVEMRNELEYFW